MPTVRRRRAEVNAVANEATLASSRRSRRPRRERYTVEQRLTNGELLYRTKDYARATVVFSEILEEFPNTPSYVDALWLRGETFYAQKEYLSARRDYRQIVDHGSEPRFSPVPRSCARAPRRRAASASTTSPASTKSSRSSNQVPPAQVDAGLPVREGQGLLLQASDSANAAAALQARAEQQHGTRTRPATSRGWLVIKDGAPPTTPAACAPRHARRTRRSRVPRRTKSQPSRPSRSSTDLAPDTAEHRQVIDLSWMAIGRLHYEMENSTQAAEAYSKVGRGLARVRDDALRARVVYVRLGDVQHAERALEVLQIADPSSPQAGDATLPPCRTSSSAPARSTRRCSSISASAKSTSRCALKLEDLHRPDARTRPSTTRSSRSSSSTSSIRTSSSRPRRRSLGAREAEDGPMAFAVIDDVNQCKQLIRQSYLLIDKLNIILNAAQPRSRVSRAPGGRGEGTLAPQPHLEDARCSIAKGLDEEEPSDARGDIAQVRAQRRALQAQMGQLPGHDRGVRRA